MAKKPASLKKLIDTATSDTKNNFRKYFTQKYLLIALGVFLVAALLWKNKSLFVVALVNGRPVPRWEMESRIISRYGSQTLDEVINEELIRQAGQNKEVKITTREVDDKIVEIEKSLNGKVSLSDALSQQGMTMAEFRGQVELQLILDKLVASSIVVTDKEVADYIASNSATLTSADPASRSAEAKNVLLLQKKNAAYRQTFTDLKSQAKISKFL